MTKNNPKEAQKSRRRDYYSKLWDVQLNPKKMHNQDLKNNMKKWIRQADEDKAKLKVIVQRTETKSETKSPKLTGVDRYILAKKI